MTREFRSGFTRRRFLGLTASGLACGFYSSVAAAQQSDSPNEKLNLAIVGTGNKGWHNVQQLTDETIVALCDVDTKYLDRAAESYPQASRYRDYREMLDREHSRIDAVVVSTADHNHAPATSIALSLGKHVYCEKPLTHTVAEARQIARQAKAAGVATQMGTQIHASKNYRRVVEAIRAGAIGQVREVFTWCNKGWSDGKFQPWEGPVPENLDWDLWLGPAAARPYSPNIHPGNWRRFWEYGSGTFGDMACHIMDLPFWALGLRYPNQVSCEGPPVDPVGAPNWVKAIYEFPATDQHGPITLHWSDGGEHFDLVANTLDDRDRPLSRWGLGVLFVGDRGMLASDYGRHTLLPKDAFPDYTAPEATIPDSVGHWKEWTAACRSGTPTTCNFDYSGALTETVLLGIVAYRSGKRLQWNAEAVCADNAPEADEFIHKAYRPGWELAK